MARGRDPLLRKVPCVCPKCGKHHKRELRWTGELPARVRCNRCNNNLSPGECYREEVLGNPHGSWH